jgi:hypothetical protein
MQAPARGDGRLPPSAAMLARLDHSPRLVALTWRREREACAGCAPMQPAAVRNRGTSTATWERMCAPTHGWGGVSNQARR